MRFLSRKAEFFTNCSDSDTAIDAINKQAYFELLPHEESGRNYVLLGTST
jgi:hypothetical protein